MDTFTNRLNIGSVISELDGILSKNRYDDARIFLEEQINVVLIVINMILVMTSINALIVKKNVDNMRK